MPAPEWPYLSDVPEWTALRHRMLRLVADRDTPVRVRYDWKKAHPDEWLHGERLLGDSERGAMRWLWDAHLLDNPDPSGPTAIPGRSVPPRQAGLDLLAIWDREHPDEG